MNHARPNIGVEEALLDGPQVLAVRRGSKAQLNNAIIDRPGRGFEKTARLIGLKVKQRIAEVKQDRFDHVRARVNGICVCRWKPSLLVDKDINCHF